jgi:hypothetical protein
MRTKGKFTKEQVIELYKSKSVNEIARIDGVSYTTIINILHRAGVKMRSRGSNEIKKAWVKHGFAGEATRLGMIPSTYVRMAALARLGGQCVACGNRDYRVLEINHINGEGSFRGRGRPKVMYLQYLEVLKGNTPGLEVRCANCNVLHEYERGNRVERCDIWNLLRSKFIT